MELNKYQQELFDHQRPVIEKYGRRAWGWSIFYLLWIGLGGYALYLQVIKGHKITGMRDNVVWGLYIANFIFFIGISYAGAVISGILHILKVEWRKPIIRIAEMITVISTIIGPIFILLCIGRLDRLHHLFLYPRLQSPITWDVLAILTYFAGSVIFLYLALIKDFAIYRDANLKVPKWKQKMYKILAIGYKGTPSQKRHISISMNLMAIMIVPLAIIVHSVLSWIFGMTLRPGWHSTIFGPYFVLAAIYSGTGVLIMAMWVYRKMYKLNSYLQDKHFIYLGYIMMILGAAYGYFTFSEYLTGWYGSEKWDSEVIGKLFNPAEYGWWFLFANVAGIILPILIVAIPKTRTPNLIAIASFFMVLALWVKRYLIIVPTLESPLLPMQDTRPEFVKYSATWVEWALTFAGIATFFLFFTIMSKFVTIIPISEFADKEKKSEPVPEIQKEIATE
ncbi:MAG TPA: polysulfide reductase NrfD [Chitinophagaceae bacterium]|nr:polysulfide reductase NrfD [Chitinophagaceae bacterium]HPG10453.1 polysulfide reductase NrfD [Chitinophagaceae bacterium]HRX93855.1 polysulfide reductase NrfD [Chitinophagaceae bacterium]